MRTILKLQRPKHSPESGFITLEILVSIFIASAFLAVSMQSLVYAMAFKVQAQEKNRANELITEQLERTNEFANRSDLAGTCDAAVYDDGYGRGLWTALNPPPDPAIIPPLPPPNKSLFSDGGGKTVALEATQVSAIGNSDAPHRSLRVRYQVWEWGPPTLNPTADNTFLNTDGAERTLPNPGTNTAGDQPIAETYVEIIPDVALACP